MGRFGKNRFGPVWHTIYHQTNLLLKGVLEKETSFLINQPMGIWDIASSRDNRHVGRFEVLDSDWFTCLKTSSVFDHLRSR
jgi:hypothetical protein